MKSDTLIRKNGHSFDSLSIEDIGDDHLCTGLDTPMKANAFEMSDDEKKKRIAILFSEIMDVLGLD